MRQFVWLFLLVLAACETFEPPPTVTPTRELTGPTVAPSPVVRGEVPTQPPQFLGQNDPTAAALPSGGALPPLPVGSSAPGEIRQTIQITAADGALLDGDLYSAGSERVPGILMLAPDSSAWLDLPLRLQAAGFTVLTMNITASTTVDNFGAALRSLSEVGTVDPGSLAVVGAEAGADLALLGCAADLLCDAAALLSPAQQEALLPAMPAFNPRPLFLAAGQGDAASFAAASALEDYTRGAAILESGSGAERGAYLVQANPAIGDRLIEWLREQFPQT